MADEQQDNGSTEDISGQEQQGQEQAPTDDTSGNGEQQPPTSTEKPVVTKDTVLPDDHPVVKQLAADKVKLANARNELTEARSQAAKATQLQEELDKRPTTEALETLQTRYDRLEAFLTALPGPVGKALDSRSFTKDLFESTKDINDIVKDWQKANPSATSTALGAGQGETKGSGPSMNEILRAAHSGS